MSVRLGGLIPILATPFDADGDLDEASLRRLVAFELDCGVDGLGLFGIASEGFSLTEGERDRILAIVVEEVAGRVPLVAGAGGTAARPAAEQARRMTDGGADALMVLPPHLVKPGPAALEDFFGTVAAVAGLPVMVQDAPLLTGVALGPALLARLAALPGVDYAKIETQPSAIRVAEVVEAAPEGFGVLGGQNALFVVEELDRGAIGTMPACEFPDALRRVLDARATGDRDGAREHYHRLLPLLRYGLQSGVAWAVHKEVLHRGGLIEHPTVRPPALAMDAHTRAGLDDVLVGLDLAALRGGG